MGTIFFECIDSNIALSQMLNSEKPRIRDLLNLNCPNIKANLMQNTCLTKKSTRHWAEI